MWDFFTVRMGPAGYYGYLPRARECVEQYVLPLVVSHITEKDKEHLWKQIDRQEKALNDGDMDQYNDADTEFHCYLINLLNNRRLVRVFTVT